MKIPATTPEHPLATIAREGATPMRAEPILLVGRDDMIEANFFTGEVLAYVKGTAGNQWSKFAARVAAMTVGARVSFLSMVREDRKDMRQSLLDEGLPDDRVKSMMASFGVQLSRLEGVARAFNAGATIEGLLEYRGASADTAPADVPFYVWFAYAGLFKKMDARGRPMKTWLMKIGNHLETTKPDADDEKAQAQYAQFIALYNSMLG